MNGAPTSGPSRGAPDALRIGTATCGEIREHDKGDDGCQPQRCGQTQPVGEHPDDQWSGEQAEQVVGQGEHAKCAGPDLRWTEAGHERPPAGPVVPAAKPITGSGGSMPTFRGV